MKIIQILPELHSGGVEKGTLELSKYLVENGHQSLVISNGGRLLPQLENQGGLHHLLPVHRKSLLTLRQISTLRALFEKEKPDLIHLRSRVPAWLAYLAWRKMNPATRPRLVSTVHGFYSVNRYSKIMTCGERVIAVSDSVRQYILKNYPTCPDSKITVIHRGIDPTEYNPDYQPPADWTQTWHRQNPQFIGKFLILLPGRITRWKGHQDFLKIINLLRQAHPEIHGVIAGDAHPKKQSFLHELKTQATTLDLNSHLTWLGHRSDLREVMAACHTTLSLSLDPEAFGRVSLEALSLGKPVAAYHHGGVGEQMTALFPSGSTLPGDWKAIAKLLTTWLPNPPNPLPNQTFTLQNMTSQTLNLYHSLLNSPKT